MDSEQLKSTISTLQDSLYSLKNWFYFEEKTKTNARIELLTDVMLQILDLQNQIITLISKSE